MCQAVVCFELVVGCVEGLYKLGRQGSPLELHHHVIIPCGKTKKEQHNESTGLQYPWCLGLSGALIALCEIMAVCFYSAQQYIAKVYIPS